jgi:hypothetical protein
MPEVDTYEYYQFHQTEQDNTIASQKKTMTKLDVFESQQKGFHRVSRKIMNPYDKNDKRNVTVKFFSTGPIGSNIRDAVTGVYYSSIVGSKEEHLYFKVGDQTCENGKYGLTLFYSSPEEYESHEHVKLSDEDKKRWFEKRNYYLEIIKQERSKRRG